VSHFNKSSGNGKAINAFTGSAAFVAAVRAAFIVTKGPEDNEGLRLFLQAKNNLANAPGLAFQVREKVLPNRITAPYIEFEKDTVDITADEILSSDTQGRKPLSRNHAEEFLHRELQKGPVPTNTLTEKAKSEGISEKTLRRAKETLGIKAARFYWSI